MTIRGRFSAACYPADFFGPRRYDYLTASSAGHSLPRLGGHTQREGHDAAAQLLSRDQLSCTFELITAYPPECGVDSFIRSLSMHGETVVLSDTYRGKPGTTIEHVLWMAQPDFAGLHISVTPSVASTDTTLDLVQEHLPQWTFLSARHWHFQLPASGTLVVSTAISI